MGHGMLVDVAVCAVPSEMTEDDLKITATVQGRRDASPRRSSSAGASTSSRTSRLPRYVEFRTELPRSPVGRVLKRTLRDEGVTATTWDAEAAGVTYEKR